MKKTKLPKPADKKMSTEVAEHLAKEAPSSKKQATPSNGAPAGVSKDGSGESISVTSDMASAAPSTKKSKSLPAGESMALPKPHKI